MKSRREFRIGIRLLVMALVFLAMSCESDGSSDGCLGNTDGMIVGCSDGCGTGIAFTGNSDGCLGDCMLGSSGSDGCLGDCGSGDCGSGDCLGDDCLGGSCGSDTPYAYQGDADQQTEGAVQIQLTNSLFDFVGNNIWQILDRVAGESLPIDTLTQEALVCIPKNSGAGLEDLVGLTGAELPDLSWLTDLPILGDVIDAIKNKVLSATLCTTADTYGPCKNTGCQLKVHFDDIHITPQAPNGLEVSLTGIRAKGEMPSGILGCTNAKITTGGGGMKISLTMNFKRNSDYPGGTEPYLELYVGGDDFDLSGIGNLHLQVSSANCDLSGIEGSLICQGLAYICNNYTGTYLNLGSTAVTTIAGPIIKSQLGGALCRGCDDDSDCGPGATCGSNNVCDYPGDDDVMCEGVAIGADAELDATSLLAAIDPAAQLHLGLSAWLDSVTAKASQGIGFGGLLASKPIDASLCVPDVPSPLTVGKQSCVDGTVCPRLEALKGQRVDGKNYHLGFGIAQGPINQLLWSVYSSGALCLSVGGDSDALDGIGDYLNTGLIGSFVTSLGPLTYGHSKPLLIQLRPQQPPNVAFDEGGKGGATVTVNIPKLAIDFYTVVDARYARIFTLNADISLPLGVMAKDNQLHLSIGDLDDVIDPDTVAVSNVQMVSQDEVQTMINMLPSLINTLTGSTLGDNAIDPIDLPDIEGIGIDMVGPGLTALNANNKPVALGLFAKLNLSSHNSPGLAAHMRPVVRNVDVQTRNTRQMHAQLHALRTAHEPIGYRDLMPNVSVDMAVTGVDIAPQDVEYTYSINGGPWSFWQTGPRLHINDPILATQQRFHVRVAARRAGDGASGSQQDASFEFVNDYTAPTVQLEADGARVSVRTQDNVYDQQALTMQTRINGGPWSNAEPIHDIDILPELLDGRRAVVDVFVMDPSGNARSVRRTFGEKNPASTHPEPSNAHASGGGCSSGEGKGGLLGVFLLIGLLFVSRRKDRGVVAFETATPAYVGLAVLALALFAVLGTGCKKSNAGQGSEGCDPACQTNETCVEGVCQAATCDSDDECPGDGVCQDGGCVSKGACRFNDDCEHGQICKDGECVASECSDSSDCDASACTDGTLPFCDYDDYEAVEAGECVCMNGLPLGNYGSWLNVMQLQDQTVVSLNYNETYGDVMFGVLQPDDTFDWQFIDGVPDGPVVFPPSGVRGGVKSKGDDAGRYVSAVVQHTDSGDVIHAAYQYVSKEDGTTSLRYARGVHGTAGWNWTTIDVDKNDRSGMFPQIVLMPGADSAGIAITYMTGDVVDNPGGGVPVKYFSEISTAYTPTAEPTDFSDFKILHGFEQVQNPASCGGGCAKNNVCLRDVNACAPTASGCGTCADGKTCVSYGGSDQCQATMDSDANAEVVPAGNGLFTTSVVDANGIVHSAYYDQVHGVLKYDQFHIDSGRLQPIAAPLIVDGQSQGQSTGDVGRWADIHLLSGHKVVIFYQDAGRSALMAAVVNGSSVSRTTLDSGLYLNADHTQVGMNRVGQSIQAIPRKDGGFDVYYQDTTDGVVRHIAWTNMSKAPTAHPDPVFGTQAGFDRDIAADEAGKDTQALATAKGAYGFFTQVLDLADGRLFASKRIGFESAVTMDVQAVDLQGGNENAGGDGGDGGNGGDGGDGGDGGYVPDF